MATVCVQAMKAGDVLQTSQKRQITPIRAKYSPRIVKRMAVYGNVFQLTSTFTNSGPFYIGRLRPAQSNFPIVPLHYVRNTSRRAVTGLPCLSHVRSLRRPPGWSLPSFEDARDTRGCSAILGDACKKARQWQGLGTTVPCCRDETLPTWTLAT